MPVKPARGTLLAALALLGFAGAAQGGVLLLRDGRALRTRGPVRRDARLAVFQLENGTWASLRAELIDWEASGRAAGLLAGPADPIPDENTRPAPGPREFERLGESEQLGSLLHTGKVGEEEGKSRWEVGAPEGGPPPCEPVEEQAGPAARPARSAARAEAAVPPGPPLREVRDSPYRGDLEEAVQPEARARLAPLLPPGEPGAVAPQGNLGPRPADPAYRPLPDDRAVFEAPRDGEAVLGATVLRALARPGGAVLRSVSYLVDGKPVGVAREAPWSLEWRAPGDNSRHVLEARLERVDGSVEVARARVLDVVPDLNVEVELVPLSVSVTNHAYFFVHDLKPEDFLIYENGVLQELAHFARDPVPLRILVAVDASWSMNGRKMHLAAEAVRGLAATLSAQDRLGVVTFAEALHVVAPIGSDPVAAAQALEQVEADGGTAMLDAEREMLELLLREDGRRILLLVGDGEDYMSRTKVKELTALFERASVTVYGVGTLIWRLKDGLPEHWADASLGQGRPGYWSDRLRVRGLKILREQTDATGGILYLPKFAGELPYVFQHLLAELKSSYQLGYYPSDLRRDGRFRSIEVVVAGQGLVARTRRGYHAPGPSRRGQPEPDLRAQQRSADSPAPVR